MEGLYKMCPKNLRILYYIRNMQKNRTDIILTQFHPKTYYIEKEVNVGHKTKKVMVENDSERGTVLTVSFFMS